VGGRRTIAENSASSGEKKVLAMAMDVAGGGKVDLSLMAKPGQGAAGRWRFGVFFRRSGGAFGWEEASA